MVDRMCHHPRWPSGYDIRSKKLNSGNCSPPPPPPPFYTTNMTKPTKWLCAQRRLRSAWASSAQSDQSLRCPLEGSWADAQADLSLRRVHTHFIGFVMLWLYFIIHEPEHDNTYKIMCAYKDSNAQDELSLRRAHRPFCWFCHETA